MEFVKFGKIPRLMRDIVITEKIDGTNASILIGEGGEFLCASRNRIISVDDDNAGFARWAQENRNELMLLGPGHHFGEWWGKGIQRGYGMNNKRFSLFNTSRWADDNIRPKCCHVVPVLYQGVFSEAEIRNALERLDSGGSVASRGFMSPEGVIVYHTAANLMFKVTIDDRGKWSEST